MSTTYSTIPFVTMNGDSATLADYQGSVTLVVNVASACGLTPQYDGLEKLYQRYRDNGLVVLGFPANNFAGQEPGSNEEIVDFCHRTYGVQFPLAQKISVAGDDCHPLYQALIAASPATVHDADSTLRNRLDEHGLGPKNNTDIMWNFEKFLLDRGGAVVARFAPYIAPEDPRLIGAIEAAL